jgi:hypothetical protein
MGFIHCTTYVGGSVYVDRSCAERESDAQTKAEKDVKTAKVDVTTPADKFLQQRLEIYLEAVEELSYHFTHIGSESPKKEIGACGPLIGKALDDGSTVVFEQHPEMKCE